MDSFNNFLLTLDGYLGSSPWFPYVLLGVGGFFTVYLGFPQIRFFRHAWTVLRGKNERPEAPGDASHFQALSLALSGTVGTGNIGGVGLAIFIGGPAALFWMWMTAFLGMATKLTEVTLSHKYRVKTDNGTMAGGPMFYMERGLKMHWLAVLFAIATIFSSFGTGNLPQVNNIALSVQSSFDVPPMLTGAVLTVLLGLVIIGGINRIKVVAATLVPAMAALYFVGALSVILLHIDNILPSFAMIFQYAFTGSAATGGFLGASFAFAFSRGVNRGLFSNEAGQGSAPIAHAAARADEPVSEGLVSLLEPFIDTIVICTLTGLVILSSGVWTEKFENDFQATDMMILAGSYDDSNAGDRDLLAEFLMHGDTEAIDLYSGTIAIDNGTAVDAGGFTIINARSVAEDVTFLADAEPFTGVLTVEAGNILDEGITVHGKSLLHSSALTTVAFTFGFLGDFGQYIVTFSLVLFAFSTAIAWSYYGDRAVIYLAGFKWVMPYRLVYCLGFFVASFTDTTIVWNFAAVSVVLMALPNLLGITLLRREMKGLVKDYWKSVKDS